LTARRLCCTGAMCGCGGLCTRYAIFATIFTGDCGDSDTENGNSDNQRGSFHRPLGRFLIRTQKPSFHFCNIRVNSVK
jgi:hypothetical protein